MTRSAALALSSLAHAGLLGVVLLACLLTVDSVPEPPIVLRFVPGPPLAMIGRLSAPPGPEGPAREIVAAPLPQPEKPRPSAPEAASATETPAAAGPAVAPSTDAEAAPADAAPAASSPALQVTGAATPALAEKDTFAPPAPSGRYRTTGARSTLTAGVVDSVASGTATAETDAPAAGLLTQVATSSRGTGRAGAPAGIAGVLPERVASVAPETRPASAGTADAAAGAGDAAPGDPAVLLGRRYRLDLVDARALGRSTHDGWRYNQLLPLLSEAYRKVALLPGVAAHMQALDDDVRSVRVDPDAIVIAYADGTRHVVAPTRDGLVALYVGTGAAGRTKIDELQRALGALRRLLDAGDRS
jgi:hypothetical protein